MGHENMLVMAHESMLVMGQESMLGMGQESMLVMAHESMLVRPPQNEKSKIELGASGWRGWLRLVEAVCLNEISSRFELRKN